MKTQVFTDNLDGAAAILENGGLVAVPTETVYGLAGNGLDAAAVEKSVAKMAKDEQNGRSPQTVANVVLKLIGKPNPPVRVAVGFEYKLLMFILRFLPDRLKQWILRIMYLPVKPGKG